LRIPFPLLNTVGTFLDFASTKWTFDHDNVVREFATGPGRKAMFLFMYEDALYVQMSAPSFPNLHVLFFVTDIEGADTVLDVPASRAHFLSSTLQLRKLAQDYQDRLNRTVPESHGIFYGRVSQYTNSLHALNVHY
jgi:hypothetical protein